MVSLKKVSDVVVEFLESKGIDHVFTVSGGGCMHLTDSLGSARKLQYICNHHEQACAMAAEGYARLKQDVGACIVTTGPGGTNALTGVLGCWLDSIPVIFVSGQVSLSQIAEGTGCRQVGDQEFNIVAAVEPMTKYAKMVKDKDAILYELEKAYDVATTGRPGPVWLDIPLDVQGANVDVDTIPRFSPEPAVYEITDEQIKELTNLIRAAKRPLFVVGNGIRLSKTFDAFDEILKATRIPVVTGVHSGVDCVDNTYEFYAGRIGILGQTTSNRIVQEADLLIILGSRLNVKTTGYNIPGFAPAAKKIIVDIDENEINKHKMHLDLKIVADLRAFFEEFPSMDDLAIDHWRTHIKDLRETQVYFYDKHANMKGYASAYIFTDRLKEYAGDRTIVTSDGSAHVVTLQTYRLRRKQRLFTNVGCASMGYGLPAAIGASIADTTKDVICIEGDGSLQMNIQELQTLVSHQLPIKLFVINNEGYLSIKITQESFFSGREVASGKNSGVSFPDLQKICAAYGLPYVQVTNNSEYDAKLAEVFSHDGPVVCELIAYPYEKHEPRVTHRGFDSEGRIIPGELTDMKIDDVFNL